MENSTPTASLNHVWTRPWQEVTEELQVSPEKGLDAEEVKRRRERYGPNRLREAQRKSAWQILADQFKSLVVWLLIAAAAISFGFGEWTEGVAIAVVIIINAVIGFVTELRAVRSMEALKQLSRVNARVRRQGQVQEIPAEELVPGDVVVVEGGGTVTADLRLIEASKLQANESALTGEAVPVSKSVPALEQDVPLAERSNMLFKGTAVTRGAGKGVVVTTGMDTELGHISSLVEEAEEEITPLEERLDQLGHRLVAVTLVIATFVALSGIIGGKRILLIIETAISLAVATVPEGLPIVATLALARGMWRMAHRNALVNRLSAVETLGATNIICTDKTGTLTENRMTVTEIALERGEIQISGEGLETQGQFSQNGGNIDPKDNVLRELLRVGVLCNNASLKTKDPEEDNKALGEPVGVALLVAGAKADLERRRLLEATPEVREEAFDPDVKLMATFHQENSRYRIAVKGAPEAVLESSASILTQEGRLEMSAEKRDRWLQRSSQMAEEGLRVLALATREVDNVEAQPYEELTFLGLAGLLDPPREEVQPAITACKSAGIRVAMVTGDHPVTARKIGLAVGLVEEQEVEVVRGADIKKPDELSIEERQRILRAPILARVTPEQKLDLITLHQNEGQIVAMTGDGVNDAPALKKADIGVAMGQRGTQVAKEAADMVLKDDAFSTIVAAVEQGRVIFRNIRKFVFYLLSCNISEILVVALAAVINAPLPIRPLQILFLNLVTDVFPALALGVGEGDPAIMEPPPRDPQEPILTRDHWEAIAGYGLLITVSVLGVFGVALRELNVADKRAITISFLTLAFAQLWHVFNMRERSSGLIRNEITQNPYVWGALALCTGLLLAAVYVPGLSNLLKTADPGPEGWLLVIPASLLPLVVGQIVKWVRK
jgi:Ca2+-transporting ATPase